MMSPYKLQRFSILEKGDFLQNYDVLQFTIREVFGSVPYPRTGSDILEGSDP